MFSATTQAIISQLKDYPCHTITLDNGSENAQWRVLEKELNVSTYYCHPYCSGERGSNENANGLLRSYFPKGTDFSKLDGRTVQAAIKRINNTPRKLLNYLTPAEVFFNFKSGAILN